MSVLQFRKLPSQAELETLVSSYVQTGNLATAALDAGMSLGAANEALQARGARSMVQRAMRQQIDAIAAPMALAALVDALASPRERNRIDAARNILDRAGYAAPAPEDRRERGLAELSRDDLASLIAELQGELASMAQPIGDAPSTPDEDFLA